ncbi:hypothetical protein LHT11_11450 [Acetobacter indonesiensis]|nr:hypothetical protein [Acetobacter indonesiensis]MCG0995816.1 hypothetical protein [Acetobacter indonesiensis]
MKPADRFTIQGWMGKASAGLVLGYLLAIGVSGILSRLSPFPPDMASVQLNMWLIAPVWLVVLSACFLFRTVLQAWLWLGSLSAVCFLIITVAGL